jgi:hypothetical protein
MLGSKIVSTRTGTYEVAYCQLIPSIQEQLQPNGEALRN